MTFSAMLRRGDLDRGDLGARVLVADGVHQPRGLEGEQPRPSRSRCAPRRSSPGCWRCSASGSPNVARVERAPAHQLERPLGRADRAHAVVDAARARAGPGRSGSRRPRRRSGSRPARARPRSDLGVALAVVVAEHRQVAHRPSRRACRSGRGPSTAARCGGAVRVGLAHHDQDLAVRVHRAGRPPLAAVEHVLVAVALDRAAGCWSRPSWRRRARSSRTPSGSRRRAAAAATAPCCSAVPNMRQHLHVAGVRRGAVARLGRDGGLRPMISASGAYSRLVSPGPILRVRDGTGSTARARGPRP